MNMNKIVSPLILLAVYGAPAWAVNCQNNIPPDNPDAIYIVHDDGTVTDTRTGLMWKQCSEGQARVDGVCSGGATGHSWTAALQLAEQSTYAQYSDWRLPNVKELGSLVESCRMDPAINDTVFPSTPQANFSFWSSSPYAHATYNAWVVIFHVGGTIEHSDQGYAHRVRLVRAGR